jgi:hypothetical protein
VNLSFGAQCTDFGDICPQGCVVLATPRTFLYLADGDRDECN